MGTSALDGVLGAQIWKPLRLAGGAVKQVFAWVCNSKEEAEGSQQKMVSFKAVKLGEMLLSRQSAQVEREVPRLSPGYSNI